MSEKVKVTIEGKTYKIPSSKILKRKDKPDRVTFKGKRLYKLEDKWVSWEEVKSHKEEQKKKDALKKRQEKKKKVTKKKVKTELEIYAPLKEEISSKEGTYTDYNRGKAGLAGMSLEVPLTTHSIRDIMSSQDLRKPESYNLKYSKKEKVYVPKEENIGTLPVDFSQRRKALKSGRDFKKGGLFAVGKYQFIPKTLEKAVKAQKVDIDAKFDAETQEKLFPYLVSKSKRENLDDFIKGRKKGSEALNEAVNDLAKEFASMPSTSGKGWYDKDKAGNKAYGGTTRVNRIKKILKQMAKDWSTLSKEENKVKRVEKFIKGGSN